MGQIKNFYNDCGMFFAAFIAPEVKYCLSINEYGEVER